MDYNIQEIISDFTLGLIDGLTVPISVASGLVANGLSREIVVICMLIEIIAGSVSMGLSNYLSTDSVDYLKSESIQHGLLTSLGYFIGGSIPLIPFIFIQNIKDGYKYAVMSNIIALIVFGYYRQKYMTNESIQKSIMKSLTVGIAAMLITYNLSSFIVKNKYLK